MSEPQTALAVYMGADLATQEARPPAPNDPCFSRPLATRMEAIETALHKSETPDARDLIRLKMPQNEDAGFVIPLPSVDPQTGEMNDKTVRRALDGVILYRRPVRAYWKKEYGAGAAGPPDCYSLDNVTGTGTPGGDCATCPLAQFGSAPKRAGSTGRGQACQQRTELYLMVPWSAMPVVLSAPPTAYQVLRKYATSLVQGMGAPYHEVITRLQIEAAANSDGVAYPTIKATPIFSINGAEAGDVSAYRQLFADYIEGEKPSVVLDDDEEAPPVTDADAVDRTRREAQAAMHEDPGLSERVEREAQRRAADEAEARRQAEAREAEAVEAEAAEAAAAAYRLAMTDGLPLATAAARAEDAADAVRAKADPTYRNHDAEARRAQEAQQAQLDKAREEAQPAATTGADVAAQLAAEQAAAQTAAQPEEPPHPADAADDLPFGKPSEAPAGSQPDRDLKPQSLPWGS